MLVCSPGLLPKAPKHRTGGPSVTQASATGAPVDLSVIVPWIFPAPAAAGAAGPDTSKAGTRNATVVTKRISLERI